MHVSENFWKTSNTAVRFRPGPQIKSHLDGDMGEQQAVQMNIVNIKPKIAFNLISSAELTGAVQDAIEVGCAGSAECAATVVHAVDRASK